MSGDYLNRNESCKDNGEKGRSLKKEVNVSQEIMCNNEGGDEDEILKLQDKKEQGMEVARQMTFLVKEGHDSALSKSHSFAREALSRKLKAKAAKQLAKLFLEKARGGGDEGDTYSISDYQ